MEDGNSFCYVSDSIWVKASPEWLGIAGTGSAGLGLHLIFNYMNKRKDISLLYIIGDTFVVLKVQQLFLLPAGTISKSN